MYRYQYTLLLAYASILLQFYIFTAFFRHIPRYENCKSTFGVCRVHKHIKTCSFTRFQLAYIPQKRCKYVNL